MARRRQTAADRHGHLLSGAGCLRSAVPLPHAALSGGRPGTGRRLRRLRDRRVRPHEAHGPDAGRLAGRPHRLPDAAGARFRHLADRYHHAHAGAAGRAHPGRDSLVRRGKGDDRAGDERHRGQPVRGGEPRPRRGLHEPGEPERLPRRRAGRLHGRRSRAGAGGIPAGDGIERRSPPGGDVPARGDGQRRGDSRARVALARPPLHRADQARRLDLGRHRPAPGDGPRRASGPALRPRRAAHGDPRARALPGAARPPRRRVHRPLRPPGRPLGEGDPHRGRPWRWGAPG